MSDQVEIASQDDAIEEAFAQLVAQDELSQESSVAESTDSQQVELPSVNVDAEPQPTPAPTPDPYEYIKELERQKADIEHRYKSDQGRVSAYQKQINELQAQLQQVQQMPQPQPQQAVQPQQANPEGSGMSDAEWNKFKDEYPEIALVVERKLAASAQKQVDPLTGEVVTRLNQLQQQVAPLVEHEQRKQEEARLAVLDNQHPEWRTQVKTAQFKQWLGQQPQAVQQLAFSDAVSDAAYLIGSYNRDTGAATSQQVAQQRTNRLQQNLGVKAKSNRQSTAIPQDFEGAFAYFTSQS